MSRPVVVPIEDALDLHAFAPREIPSVVESYLEAAPPPERGGWGATIVWLGGGQEA